MTFINRRIIKRPTLFATSRRNFGNLLTHYETGQDGTTPEPGPDPDPTTPISFTVSWATNGGIIQANLVGIQDGDGTEVITLTRDDGSILATLASGSLGNHTLQHDEGTNYNTYTYTIRLDGVVQSSFTRTYEPNTPSFTTNFFSNTAKVISCGIENITNPHESYSVRLARPDTILDTQVLNDASSFFLQFTESDYGTYDYKLLLSKWTTTSTSNPNIPPESYWVDTVIATHTQLFPRPEPTFTTSWTKSGLTINADLSSITGAHPDFYAYLCRDDGTTLATHQFQTGQTTTSLSFTETNYGTFTYQLKLGTTVVSTHTETYIRPEPTFTTSWTKSGLTINADLSSITGAHPDFYAYLCRDDGTTLATHQFQTGQTTTSLSFTEPDYGTFTYQLKLGTTVVSTHTETYIRPEPTFTTSWTKSGLSITADLSSITGAHPEFYAYLCRDDGTTLATHQFTEGETTTLLTFTETEYGTFTYQLKLGTTEVSTHTETYVRPTPDYTASFSTNELTLTASITGITNAHNSFAITLERDDGTVLSTHTLVENETSFNFTQTETSYATFNYIVKLNGAQTDTYSATYTPPPTPTFDIALTNDDLAITATLTNIVNPDPYYTLMIHDANDTHLDGHTFATGDTTATLTWTETSYGEKTYTKLLNGASIGTETITLTDPNASSTTSTPTWTFTWDATNPSVPDGGTMEITYDGTNWSINNDSLEPDFATHATISATAVANSIAIGYYDFGAWVNGWSFPNTYTSGDVPASAISGNWASSFVSMIEQGSSSTPAVPQPTLVNTISLTDGDWFPSLNYQHQATDTTNTYYEYKISGAPTDTQFYIAYNWTTKKWYDTNPNTTHSTFGTSASDTTSTSRETGENPSIVYVMGDTPTSILKAQFNNPYYEPPTVVSPLPALSQHTQAFGMEYYQTVGTKYYYKSDSHSGTGTSITYDYETKTWNDEGSQVPYHLNTTSTFASTTSLVNPAEIHGFGSQQNHNGTRYFSVSNPYYEAPAYRTGTSQGFAFTSGTWKGYGYTAIIDDEANSSSGKLVNGVRQWEWDMPDIGGGRLYSGANNWIYFVPGTAEDNGTWYHSSTSTGGTAGTRNGRVISIGTSATFDETNAFVDGLVPYGDIP